MWRPRSRRTRFYKLRGFSRQFGVFFDTFQGNLMENSLAWADMKNRDSSPLIVQGWRNVGPIERINGADRKQKGSLYQKQELHGKLVPVVSRKGKQTYIAHAHRCKRKHKSRQRSVNTGGENGESCGNAKNYTWKKVETNREPSVD